MCSSEVVASASSQIWMIAALAMALAAVPAGDQAQAAGKSGSGGSARGSGKSHSGKNQSRHQFKHTNTAVAAGIFVGAPWWPWWDYPAWYPPVTLAPVPVVYIERSEQEGQAAADWLYCAQAQGYFPYVTECAEGWERVPVTPLK